jgi:hypothetical protein
METVALYAPPATVKRDRVLYWLTTFVIAVVMASSALYFAFGPSAEVALQHLGLPRWFLAELTVAKLLGVVALVVPRTPSLMRQFAYFGFALTIVSADIAHLSSGDSPFYLVPHLFFLGCLVTSYVLFYRLEGRRPSS